MIRLLYFIAIQVYGFIIQIAAWCGNTKAKHFTDGRKRLFEKLASSVSQLGDQRIWFHCASLGEFEQARPIIERIKNDYNTYSIVVTFFSPSGYEIRKNYPLASGVFYLPLDSPQNAQKFVSILKPTMAFFVKYEIWYYYLEALRKHDIPVFLLSAHFRKNQVYFKRYGSFFKKMLFQFTHIFAQNQASANLLKANQINNVSITNDTRFDRVAQHRERVQSLPLIEMFKQHHKLLIAGSSYLEEEKIIAQTLSHLKDWKFIIAPHHIHQSRIEEIEHLFKSGSVKKYSKMLENPESIKESNVLIIDNIGLLASIYQYGDAAFVGGGFGKSGLHNMLEPASFGLPIMIGPHHHEKFPESITMQQLGCCFTVNTQQDYEELMESWGQKPESLLKVKEIAHQFVQSNKGATDKVMNHVEHMLQR